MMSQILNLSGGFNFFISVCLRKSNLQKNLLWYIMLWLNIQILSFLLERKSSSLRQLFEDAKGVEENIRACKMLRDQAHVEDIQAYEQEEERRYHSYLRLFSSSFSYEQRYK